MKNVPEVHLRSHIEPPPSGNEVTTAQELLPQMMDFVCVSCEVARNQVN